ncbi:MAG: DUF6916 family protein [Pyrinomonadaceae bacterium]
MSVSRRRFLRSGAMGALSAGLIFKAGSLVLVADSKSSNSHSRAFDYSRANFESHLGSTFQLRQGKRVIDLKLVGLRDYQPRSGEKTAKSRSTESFVLAFQAARNLPRSSTAYQLEHAKIGKFDLFMTRSGSSNRAPYNAVINRLV